MSDNRRSGPDFSRAGPVAYNPTADSGAATPAGGLPTEDESRLLAVPGVVSVGIGKGRAGGEVLVVGVTHAGVAQQLPREMGGWSLDVRVTGPVDALPSA